jgi:hypothetical protein
MSAEEIDAYVRAALPLLGYRFDEAQQKAIAAEFARIAALAAPIVEQDLPHGLEALAQFRP